VRSDSLFAAGHVWSIHGMRCLSVGEGAMAQRLVDQVGATWFAGFEGEEGEPGLRD
jgi:hypothetical protein